MQKLKGLFKWAHKYKYLILIIIILTIIIPITYSYSPQFIRYIFDEILPKSSQTTSSGKINLPKFLLDFYKSFSAPITAIVVVAISMLLFQALRGSIMFVNGYFKGRLSENVAYDLRNTTYDHIQNLSLDYHNGVDTGDLIQRCTTDIETIKSFISAQLPELFHIITSFTAGAIQMARMNYKMMLVTLSVAPITITASIIYYRFVTRKYTEIEELEAEMTTVLQENINGVRVVKAFSKEQYEIDKFNEKNDAYRESLRKFNSAVAMYWGLTDLVSIMQYVVTIGVGVYFARNNLLTGGEFIAFMMYIGMLVWPIRGLGRIIGDFGKAVVSSERINEILSIETEYVSDGSLQPEIKGNIEFKNVYFKFHDAEKPLLNGLNLTISSGESIAIVGKTGSGKSTLANILVRLLEYDSGSITIDGYELRDISKRWIREHIGIILQDPFLYGKTVYENIAIARTNIPQDEIYAAAKNAAVHNDIINFDQGYHTLVGEKGTTLSGGQKQRVAIARMLVLNKPIIILDDSLSAVDTKTDVEIRRALRKQNQNLTSIIITHRIATAKEADKIVVLENGTVSHIGSHDELIKTPGLYQTLWSIQGNLEDEFLALFAGEDNHETI